MVRGSLPFGLIGVRAIPGLKIQTWGAHFLAWGRRDNGISNRGSFDYTGRKKPRPLSLRKTDNWRVKGLCYGSRRLELATNLHLRKDPSG